MSVAEIEHGQSEDPWVPRDTFGARLALVRQHMGWNIAEAARACALDPQSWANWESGASPRRFEEVAEKIHKAAGCNLVWLLAGDAAVARSRWFSALAEVSAPDGFQPEIPGLFARSAELALVP